MDNAPKLRFKEHQEEWTNGDLRSLTTLITKGTTPRTFAKSGVLFVKIEALNGTSIDVLKCQYIDSSVHYTELRRSILEENDIIFAIAGSIGKLGVVHSKDLPANTNQALAIIRLKNTEYLPFVLQILQSSVMKRYIKKSISVGAQPNLNLQQVGDFKFFQPSLAEQQKIASFLTAVDTKIEQLTQKEALLKQYKKGVMQKIFSQEIRFKADDGSEFPEWEEHELSHYLKIKATYGIVTAGEFVKDGVKMVRGGDIKSGQVSLDTMPCVTFEVAEEYSRTQLQKDDIVIALVGYPGEAAKIPDALVGQNISRAVGLLRLCDLDSDYLVHYLNSDIGRRVVLRPSAGSAQQVVNLKDLNRLRIPIPCRQEQRRIADVLSVFDNKLLLTTHQLEAARTFKKGLLQQMFV